jgi:hypothetical protein
MFESRTMTEARTNFLAAGIQQTNRYIFKYSKMDIFLYPYEIILPGLGYESIDHSIWSIVRKIPFRRAFTDLQVKFIMGKTNYKHFIELWNTTVSKLSTIDISQQSQQVLLQNGVSPSSAGIESTNQAGVNAAERTLGNSFLSSRIYQSVGNAIGGAPQYTDYIGGSFATVGLINEKSKDIQTTLKFNEAYITQIQPTQMTSVETGYSTFTVNFKFSSVDVL